ncbi:MAG: hypothetical protein AAF919_03960 [Pseudomonadota bacterium]
MTFPTLHPPVTLHLGAHQTGAASLARALTKAPLAEAGIALWTPDRIRGGVLTGVTGDPGRRDPHRDVAAHRTAGRVALLRRGMALSGIERLILTDPALLGSLRENLTLGQLYPTAGARLARLQGALPGIDRICLAIRAPGLWWRDALAHLAGRGFAPPLPEIIAGLARTRRGWQQVIEDLAEQAPEARIHVWAQEEAAPRDAVAIVTGGLVAQSNLVEVPRGSSAGGMPFTAAQCAALQDRYAADLDWLRAGADGLATFGMDWPATAKGQDRKGWDDGGRQAEQMGPPGRGRTQGAHAG